MENLTELIDTKICELLTRIRPGSPPATDLAVAGAIKELAEARKAIRESDKEVRD